MMVLKKHLLTAALLGVGICWGALARAQLWQVDFQGNANNNGLFGQTPPIDVTGPGSWNVFEVQAINARPSVEGVPSDITSGSVSLPLVDSTGAASSVALEVESAGGFLSGWAGSAGADPLRGDYLLALSPVGDNFFGYPAASSPLNFNISGLMSNSAYDLTFVHGNVSSNRGLDIVANGVATSISTSSLESTITITSNASGVISGTGSFFGDEGDWAGLTIARGIEPPQPTYRVERVTGGMDRPTYVTQAPGDNNTLYIIEQHAGSVGGGSLGAGRIRRFDLSSSQLDPTPFVQIGGIDTTIEGGVHTMAFHPDFQANGKFYVTWLEDGGTGNQGPNDFGNVDEYVVVDGDAQFSRKILRYQLRDNRSTHGLNWVGFDPTATGDDRDLLHITTGDSGFAGNNINNNFSQDLTNIDGKMLRVDVGGGDDYPGDPDKNFEIPDANPYVNDPNNPDALGEVLHSGLRNPWRASFDRETGDMFIGDVGLGSIEEIDFIRAGETGIDFGWNQFEGTIDRGGTSLQPDPRSPIHEYSHSVGFSVTGGYVYRGPIEELQGRYFFGDFVTADIWSGEFDRDIDLSSLDGTNLADVQKIDELLESMIEGGATFNQVVSFGEDNEGNLYIIDFAETGAGGVFDPIFDTGEIFRLVPIIASVPGDFDSDGDVDGADFLAWQRGESPNPLSVADLAEWQASYNASGSVVTPSAAVPEPASSLLLTVCLILAWGMRCNSTSHQS